MNGPEAVVLHALRDAHSCAQNGANVSYSIPIIRSDFCKVPERFVITTSGGAVLRYESSCADLEWYVRSDPDRDRDQERVREMVRAVREFVRCNKGCGGYVDPKAGCRLSHLSHLSHSHKSQEEDEEKEPELEEEERWRKSIERSNLSSPHRPFCVVCQDSSGSGLYGRLDCGHVLHEACMFELERCPLCRCQWVAPD